MMAQRGSSPGRWPQPPAGGRPLLGRRKAGERWPGGDSLEREWCVRRRTLRCEQAGRDRRNGREEGSDHEVHGPNLQAIPEKKRGDPLGPPPCCLPGQDR